MSVTDRKASDEEITQAMTVGITFKGAKLKKAPDTFNSPRTSLISSAKS